VGLRRREVELSLERPVGPAGPAGGVARLTARFDSGPDSSGPTPAELRKALDDLSTELDALVGPPLAAAPLARADRELGELVETYRPRQRELVDLLRDEGELTATEHARLVEYLGSRTDRPSPAPRTVPPPIDRPIAAAPIGADRSLPPARPVAELLREYGIASLKQAGAVRARRQISFAEYMALKRHFEGEELPKEPRPASSG
jgi:hypothetical protein